MFSKNNKLLPAPSSNSQYRRARKHLEKFNQSLTEGETIFIKSPKDLNYILSRIEKNLIKSSLTLRSEERRVGK